MEGLRRVHGEKRGNWLSLHEGIDVLGQWQVTEPIGVVGHEDRVIADVVLHSLQPLSDRGVDAGVDEGDPPVIDVRIEQLEVSPTVGQHEVIGDGLVVVEEVILHHFALVSQGRG